MTTSDNDLNLEYRKLLQDLEIRSLESYDKAVMTLSGGGLAISFAFIKDIIGNGSIECKALLMISWISWSTSILVVILSFLCSHYALRNAITSIDNDDKTEHLGGKFDILTKTLNILSGLLFFIGTICMILFATSNIG